MVNHKAGPAPVSIIQRFWNKVDKGLPDECWLWLGFKDYRGYGSLWDNDAQRNIQAHRVAYFVKHGKYPDNYACHSCDNPSCVNPDHIFDGTPLENSLDMISKGRNVNQYKDRPACSAGHIYTEETTYISRQGVRICRVCRRKRWKTHKNKKLGKVADN